MSTRSRVWITGAGVVSPGAVGRARAWERLRDLGLVARPAGTGAATLAAAGFSVEEYLEPRYVRRLSALSRSALVAARLALEDAGYPADAELRSQTGAILGTAFGSAGYHFEYYEALYRRGLKEASPLLFSESVLNAASGHLGQYFGLRGPSVTLSGGEDVGLAAVGSALDKIRAGGALALLAGGGEEHCPTIHRALVEAGAVTDARPLPPEGAGLGFVEGAALVLLEAESAGRRRGARALAEVAGAGWGRAGFERTGHAAAGRPGAGEHVCRAALAALEDAGIRADDVGLVVAAGGPLGEAELAGLARALHSERLLIFAAPATLLGEGFGFTSALGVVLCAHALSSGEAPPGGHRGSIGTPPGAWRFALGGEKLTSRYALTFSSTRRRGASALVLARVSGL